MKISSLRRKSIHKIVEATDHTRTERKVDSIIIGLLSIAWALFQLSLPRFVLLDSVSIRAIHLAFAIALVYLSFPMLKKTAKTIPGFHSRYRIPILDYVLAAVAAVAVLYIVLDWEGISMRSGRPLSRDIVAGFVIIVVLLEASRRCIGLPMVIIALLFTAYAFLGPYLPGFLAYRGVSVTKYVSQMALSTEGIYGIPLDVSATTVFLFVLFGSMLERLGAGQFFNDVAIALLGRFKGGPAKASVVSSGLTGMVSGSSIANVVTTGTFTIPLMKKVGYPGPMAAATEVAASTNGQLMPPIMGAAAFIIAEYLGIGYLDVVRAAFLPGVVSYIALFYITHLEASKLGMRGLAKEEIPGFWEIFKNGFHHLIPVLVLIHQLAVLRRSPNLSVFNAILVMVGILILRILYYSIINQEPLGHSVLAGLSRTVEGMISGVRNMIPVAMATATAGIIVGIVNMGIGSMIVQIVERLAMGNVFLLLLITAIVSLIIGMGLPTTATYIVMASITAPVIISLGGGMGLIIPAIAAHLFVFYFGILADDTPPVGLAAYAAAAIAESDPIQTGIKGFIYDLRTAVIPFMFVFNAELLLINVTGFFQVSMVFLAATLGTLAFTNAVQGWFVTRNRWYEIPIFAIISLMFYLPGRVSIWLGMGRDVRYWLYLVALAIYGGVMLLQRLRSRESVTDAATG